MTHHRHIVESAEAPAAIGPYSQAVVAGGLVFCSGQIALDPASGELVEGGASEQATRCLESLAAIAEAAGTSLADAARLTVYLFDLHGDWEDVNAAYESFFTALGAEPPARVAVGVKALPRGARVEIDAVVALPD